MKAPNFIIAGERRSGTTSLSRWIENHPDIYLLPRFDTAFFIDDDTKGRVDKIDGQCDYSAWHKKHSVSEYHSLFSEAESQLAVGEKSADYFYWQPAHSRIQQFTDNIKLVLILRNPVERAWSHYINEVGKGRETLAFDQAISQEKRRMSASDFAKNHLSYVERGRYDISFERLLETFDRESIHVVVLDELKESPIKTLKSLYNFLGVDENQGLKESGRQHNKNWATFQKPWVQRNMLVSKAEHLFVKMLRRLLRGFYSDPFVRSQVQLKIESLFRNHKGNLIFKKEDKDYLYATYLPHIARLEKLIGKDLSCWRQP